jgi:hypothetical protein
MPRRCRALAAALAGLATAGLVGAAPADEASDRLDRFRELAASRLTLGEILEPERPEDAYRGVWALLDEEIVENLASGGVFASDAFLQDRLDAFREAWGGARLAVARLGSALVGAFALGEAAGAQSLRVYGALGSEPALLATQARAGLPSLFRLSPAQLLVAWEGRPAGAARALRLEVLRPGREGVQVAWSTATLFPDGLRALAWSVRQGEVRIRYEVRYPGWAPGCEGQTEQEDVYRLDSRGGMLVRVSRQQHNGWHRELHAAATRVFDALAKPDPAALRRLVPDARLRERLPAALRPEPACDAFEDDAHDAVSIAATAAEGRPWSLVFRRSGQGWRLSAANPVLQ